MSKPIIGIISRASNIFNTIDVQAIEETNRNAILKAGGIPVMILPTQQLAYQSTLPKDVAKLTESEKSDLNQTIELCDGILSPGGLKAYEYDYYISDYAKEHNIPFLGICLGMQVMARSNGGADIVKNDTDIKHYNNESMNAHTISIEKDSILHDILLQNEIMVNSFHNYHLENVKDFDIVARSSDGMVEAIEDKNNFFRVGIQWHPEKTMDDSNSLKIFESFIDAASSSKQKDVSKRYNMC